MIVHILSFNVTTKKVKSLIENNFEISRNIRKINYPKVTYFKKFLIIPSNNHKIEEIQSENR